MVVIQLSGLRELLTGWQEEEVLNERCDEVPGFKMDDGTEEVEAVCRSQRDSNISERLVREKPTQGDCQQLPYNDEKKRTL